MEPPRDLYRASREELMAGLMQQREHLAAQEQELVRLRAELVAQQAIIQQLSAQIGMLLAAADPGADGAHPHAMPGLKPAARCPAPAGPRPARKQRVHGYNAWCEIPPAPVTSQTARRGPRAVGRVAG